MIELKTKANVPYMIKITKERTTFVAIQKINKNKYKYKHFLIKILIGRM